MKVLFDQRSNRPHVLESGNQCLRQIENWMAKRANTIFTVIVIIISLLFLPDGALLPHPFLILAVQVLPRTVSTTRLTRLSPCTVIMGTLKDD